MPTTLLGHSGSLLTIFHDQVNFFVKIHSFCSSFLAQQSRTQTSWMGFLSYSFESLKILVKVRTLQQLYSSLLTLVMEITGEFFKVFGHQDLEQIHVVLPFGTMDTPARLKAAGFVSQNLEEHMCPCCNAPFSSLVVPVCFNRLSRCFFSHMYWVLTFLQNSATRTQRSSLNGNLYTKILMLTLKRILRSRRVSVRRFSTGFWPGMELWVFHWKLCTFSGAQVCLKTLWSVTSTKIETLLQVLLARSIGSFSSRVPCSQGLENGEKSHPWIGLPNFWNHCGGQTIQDSSKSR